MKGNTLVRMLLVTAVMFTLIGGGLRADQRSR